MTKEEIVSKAITDMANKYPPLPYSIFNFDRVSLVASQAATEYAKQECMAFVEWIAISGWYFNKIKRWSNRNENSDNLILVLSATKTTAELYTQFIEHQSKQV